jgi:hypothetical protein
LSLVVIAKAMVALLIVSFNLLSSVCLLRLFHRALTGRFTAAPEIAPVRRLWRHALERTDGSVQNARLRRADCRLSLAHRSRSIDHQAAKGVDRDIADATRSLLRSLIGPIDSRIAQS